MAIRENDPYQPGLSDDEILRRRSAQFDTELQPDPELAEGQAGSGRIALFAVAFIAILGVVFYGLNQPSVMPSATSTAQTTSPVTGPVAAPRPPAGQTTGSAMSPSAPANPPAVVPANPPADSSPNLNTAPAPSAGGTSAPAAPSSN